MKKTFFILLVSLLLVACKNSASQCEECETYIGDFLYFQDAAVLKGKDFIYAVELNEQAKKIAKKIQPIKNEEYDMVEITVKGIVSPKSDNEEGWDEILNIKEIITIADEVSEADILIQQ